MVRVTQAPATATGRAAFEGVTLDEQEWQGLRELVQTLKVSIMHQGSELAHWQEAAKRYFHGAQKLSAQLVEANKGRMLVRMRLGQATDALEKVVEAYERLYRDGTIAVPADVEALRYAREVVRAETIARKA